MGRKKSDNKVKSIIPLIICLILFFLGAQTEAWQLANEAGITNILNTSNQDTIIHEKVEIQESIADNINIDTEKLNILYFDVGQADCELVMYKNKTMLIDAGNVEDGEMIVTGLKQLGINKIDYLVGTHVHEDHVGGMSYIIDSFEIGEFYLPYNISNTTNYYEDLLNSVAKKEMQITEINTGDKIQIEDIICEVMCVDNKEPENTNASSIVLELTYENQKYLFMADAEKENEKSRKWNDVDVLKVGHHGSNTSSTEEFLEQVLPEISIISVGERNSYGLPKDTILKRLDNINTTTYRTDFDGTIQIISDGKINEVVKIDLSFDGNVK